MKKAALILNNILLVVGISFSILTVLVFVKAIIEGWFAIPDEYFVRRMLLPAIIFLALTFIFYILGKMSYKKEMYKLSFWIGLISIVLSVLPVSVMGFFGLLLLFFRFTM